MSTIILFLIGFGMIFDIFNPSTVEKFDGFSLTALNIQNLDSLNLMIYFNYIFLGLLVVVFSLNLRLLIKSSKTNRIAVDLLLLSGAIWVSCGFFTLDEIPNGLLLFWVFIRPTLILVLASTGFILFGNEFDKIIHLNLNKWIIVSVGILIVIVGITQVFTNGIIQAYLSYTSWLLYFIGYSILGLGMLIKPKDKTVHNNVYN